MGRYTDIEIRFKQLKGQKRSTNIMDMLISVYLIKTINIEMI